MEIFLRIFMDPSSQTQGRSKETTEKPYLFIDEIATGGNERSNRRKNRGKTSTFLWDNCYTSI
jgi:hypothetical protein